MAKGRIAAPVLACAFLLAVQPAAGRAAQFLPFSALPATFNARQPQTSSYFRLPLAGGGTTHQKLVVVNLSSRPLTLSLYPVEGLTGATSGTVYSNFGTPPQGPARWLKLPTRTLALAPHSRRYLPFTVTVPKGAQPGDHVAGVALQEAPLAAGGGRFAVREIVRVVVGVEVVVPGPASPQLVISSLSLGRLGGTARPAVEVGLANRGRLLCKPTLTVSARRSRETVSESRHLDTILPGQAITYPFPWHHPLPAGNYALAAVGSACGRPTYGREAAYLAKPIGGAANAPGKHTTTIPWLPLGVGAGAFLLGLIFGARRRRKPGPLADGTAP